MLRKLASVALAAIALAGCASTSASRSETGRLWPPPPETPRVRHVQTLASDLDLPRKGGALGWLADLVGGGEAPKGLNKPFGVYAHEGRVFVSDTGWKRVLVFDPALGKVAFWGGEGPLPLGSPMGLTGDGADGLWVADSQLKRIVHLDGQGAFQGALGRDGDLERPVAVALDPAGDRLYVVDTGAHRLVVFDLSTGEKLKNIGERGTGEGEFNYPTSIACGANGLLYVGDTMNFRVQVLDREGTFVRTFGGNCNGPGCTPRLKGIGLDSEGHVYVVDAAFSIFQIFDPEGHPLLAVGGTGTGPGELQLPAGIHVDPDDRIYVADQLNQRVNVYQYLGAPDVGEAEAPASAPQGGETAE